MSDNFYKTIGVQNNIILRGKPLLTPDAKVNPSFIEKQSSSDVELKTSLDKTNKEVESLTNQLKYLSKEIEQLKKSTVQVVNNKPVPAPPAPVVNKPSAKPVTRP